MLVWCPRPKVWDQGTVPRSLDVMMHETPPTRVATRLLRFGATQCSGGGIRHGFGLPIS